MWLIAHVTFMTIGLGILIPIGIALRVVNFPGHAFVQVLGVFLALVGVGWAAFFVDDIGSKPHHVVGIVALVIFVVLPITIFARPSESSSAHFVRRKNKTNDRTDLLAEESGPEDQEQSLRVWAIFHGLFGYLAVLLAVINSFLGIELVNVAPLSVPGLSAVPIIFAVFNGAAFTISVGRRVYLKLKPKHTLGDGKTQNDSSVLSISSNPKFDNNTVKGDDMLDPPGPPEEGEVKVTPSSLVFMDVGYQAPITKQEKRVGKEHGRTILMGCSGFCIPGSLTAIMGPSGSGKTSLLDLLASRARHQPEAGSIIEVNGLATYLSTQSLAKTSGYVLQEDVLHQYLTVFETLMMTARLILPATFTDQQRYDRVIRIIAQLGLGHAIDTKVGGPEVRGLSGGERRRVAVGIQIIKSPSLLFLDEPTSGLDSSTATKLVESLRELANEGRTVIATIHQPSVQIFNSFDRLILLSAGRVVWSGLRTAAEVFFQLQGRPVPAKWNPADWFLFVVDVNRDEDSQKEDQKVVPQDHPVSNRMSYRLPISPPGQSKSKRPAVRESVLMRATAAESKDIDVSILNEVVTAFYQQHNPEKMKSNPEIIDEVVKYGMRKGLSELDKKLFKTYGSGITNALFQAMSQKSYHDPLTMAELDKWVKAFQSTSAHREIETRLRRVRQEANASGNVALDVTTDKTISLGTQARILIERGGTLAWRDPQVLRFQALQNAIFGIVLGSLYSNLRNSQSQAYTLSMAIAIILGIVAMITIALNTAVAFSDKQVFVREQNDNMYSPVAHFFARLVVGLPISVVVAACLILPSYWWIGLRSGATPFFFFFGINLAMIFLFDGIVGVTVFLANDVTTAFGLGNFFEAISIFMSGIFIPYPLIPPFWVWLYWITPFSFAYAACAINEFEGTENEFWLYAIGIVWLNKWGNLLVIILMGVLWRFLGLILAIRVHNRTSRNMKPKGTV